MTEHERVGGDERGKRGRWGEEERQGGSAASDRMADIKREEEKGNRGKK